MHGLACLALIFSDAGIDEWALLGTIAFILFGPKRLPEIARTLGRMLARLRHAADSFRDQIEHLDQPASTPAPDLHPELPVMVQPALKVPESLADARSTSQAGDNKAEHPSPPQQPHGEAGGAGGQPPLERPESPDPKNAAPRL